MSRRTKEQLDQALMDSNELELDYDEITDVFEVLRTHVTKVGDATRKTGLETVKTLQSLITSMEKK